MKAFDVLLAAKAQEAFCERNRCPMFAPKNGWCNACGHNIFEAYACKRGGETITYGISVEEAGNRLITGCPFCHTSFTN